MRVETSDIDTQTLQDLMSQLQSSSSSSSSTLSGDDLQDLLRSSVLVDNIAGLNIRYFDGNDWLDTWDMDEEKAIPKAAEITLSVTDPENKGKAIKINPTILNYIFWIVFVNFTTMQRDFDGGFDSFMTGAGFFLLRTMGCYRISWGGNIA
jgi:hypothetical protein